MSSQQAPAHNMEYRRLGNTGLKVSVFSFGAWVTFHEQINLEQVKEIFQACKDAGVNFFDNAEAYAKGQAEVIMGKALKELGWNRSEYVVSTKIFFGTNLTGPNTKGLSRKHIIEGTKASLERLGMEYVDLIFCHRPDPETPIEETVRAMNWVIDQGWAFYWGTSEWSAEQIQEAWDIAKRLNLIGPAMEQPEYNMFNRTKVEKDYKPLYDKYGLGLTTWSPLAYGILTGKYSGGKAPEGSRLALESYKWLADKAFQERRVHIDAADQLKPIADELGCTMAQLALAWTAKNPNVSTVITGGTKIDQVKENMKAVEIIPKLTDDVVSRIEAIIKTKPN